MYCNRECGLMTSLPCDGNALAAFKASNLPPENQRWRAAVVLDDPDARLAELEGFSELDQAEAGDNPNEAIARQAAHTRSVELRAACTPDDELAPYFERSTVLLASRSAEPPDLPVTVAPNLLLGDADAAADVAALAERGVTHVLNASDEAPERSTSDAYARAGIVCRQLGAVDDILYDMRVHLSDSAAFVEDAISKGGTCLVHCVAGINRSGFIVGGLCMLRGQRPVLEVLAELKRVRGTVLLNQAFQLQLLNVARDHGLLGDLRSPNRADRAER